jgi:hypothetical protein
MRRTDRFGPFAPGDFVRLDRFAAENLASSFLITVSAGPSYLEEVCGTVDGNDILLILEISNAAPPGGDPEEFVKILTPKGVGWIASTYIERA